MTASIELSPLGTARVALPANAETTGAFLQEAALLEWLEKLREPLGTQYNLENEISAIAWELARWQPGLNTSERQALVLLILLALVQVRQGNTRIALHGARGAGLRLDFARRLLARVQSADESSKVDPSAVATLMMELIERDRASALIGRACDFKPLVVVGDYLYLQKMLHLENRFVSALRSKLDAGVPGWQERDIDLALSNVLDRPPKAKGHSPKLNDEQREAVRAAVQSAVTIISGGPGTGKTTIVVSILRVLSRLGVAPEEIALAAPTGKAANRMQSAIQEGLRGIANPTEADRRISDCLEPRTLHRLLGYSPSSARFHHHENNRLSEKIVIVDEASMIDLALMERLVRSLRDDGRLILLGDARQLPSVDAGAVLRDLLKAWEEDPRRSPSAVILEESYRMRPDDPHGSNLLSVARKIDQGEAPRIGRERSGDDVVVERGSVDELEFQGVEFVARSAVQLVFDRFLKRWEDESLRARPGLEKLIEHVYALSSDDQFAGADLEKLRELFDYWGAFRLLCVTRVLPTGSDRINELSHRRTLNRLNSRVGADQFVAGEPVMMQVNDYQRMIFNGDQGVILRVAERGRARSQPMAVFGRLNGFTAFHLDSLRSSLALSYAMTVHKAQGSEFERVALLLPDRDVPINTREILYTALSRARKSAVIVGDREIFEAGIKRTCDRDSGIVEKLRA
jgi:exodeoxyribonuclease V alpha subunit